MNRLPAVRAGAVLLFAGVVLVALHGRASAEGVAEPAPVSLPAPLAATVTTLPPLPTTPTTGTATAPAPVPSLPASPSGPPGITSPPGGSTGTQDPCAEVVDHATASGAPVAASCPLTSTSDGGAEGALCVDVALKPSCASAQAVSTTTTTAAASMTPAPSPTAGASDDPAASSADPTPTNDTAVEAAAMSSKQSSGTLPFTGGEAAVLATIGATLAGCGLTLARSARRRSI
jgi:hypothetical protein